MPYELLEDAPQVQGPEANAGFVGRTGLRSLARAGEAIAGLPGDIASSLVGLADLGISKISGVPYSSNLPLPTSQAIRENITKPLTGEYLEPQSGGEKFYDEIIGDAATLFLPVKGKVPFAKAAGRALGVSTAGNVAKWGAEKVTDSPLVGIGAKIGGMALASTFGGRKALTAQKDASYKDAFAKVPPDAKFNFTPEKDALSNIAKTLRKGDHPEKQFMLERLAAIDNVVDKAGDGEIRELIGLKQDWNKHLADPSLTKGSRDLLKRSVGIVNDGIKRFGSRNPEFYKPYKLAEELTGALQSTNYVQKILAKSPYLQEKVSNPFLKKILWSGAAYGVTHVPPGKIAAAGATLLGAREGARFYQLLSRSSNARQYYKGLIEASLKNDTKSIARNLSKLDMAANHFDKKNPEEIQQKAEADGRYELLD